MTRSIILVVPSLHNYDAVGSDVLLQKDSLQKAGERVFLYADQVDPSLSQHVIDRLQFHELIHDSRNLVIYHFGVFWQHLPELIAQAKARLWVRYHNVTPPHFFSGWDKGSYYATAAGQNQARWLAEQTKVELFISASAYNLIELSELTGGMKLKSAVIAPMTELLSSVESDDASVNLDPDVIHVLFVGRVVPNKAHKHLLGTLRSFQDLFPGKGIQLHIVGSHHPNFKHYLDFLTELAKKAGIDESIKFWGKAPSDVLKNLYHQATVFLCMSEHEGFCVPLVEAQVAGLPILALARAAIPDTLGPEQLLMGGEVNYDHAACLIHEITCNTDLREHIIAHGRKNATRYSKQNLGGQLTHLVHQHF